ncbi:hypothetical protein LCGC14_1127700 [marine sediment metagenome]|uniref:Uncharacterized protein n=1 Tax=marine sediment metagenome TaxID=412755 RepID=A0A0F9M6V4_9ZZZZ
MQKKSRIMKLTILIITLSLTLAFLLTGCSTSQAARLEVNDLEWTTIKSDNTGNCYETVRVRGYWKFLGIGQIDCPEEE